MKFPELAGEVGLREMLGNFTGLPAACEHKAEPSGLGLRTCPHTAQQHMRAYHPAHQGVSPTPAPQPIVSGRATDHHPNTGHLTSVSSTTALRSPFTKSRGRPQYIQDRSTWGLASLCQATSAAETSPPTSFQASSTRCQWSGHLPLQGDLLHAVTQTSLAPRRSLCLEALHQPSSLFGILSRESRLGSCCAPVPTPAPRTSIEPDHKL